MNESIIKAFRELCGKEFKDLKLAFVPTAANIEAGDKDWLLKDYEIIRKLGFKEFDIVDISAIPMDIWMKRLENAEVLVFGGGNNYHLAYWIKKSRLAQILPELLKTKVYVGISAGSLVLSKSLVFGIDEKPFAEELDGPISDEGLGLVEFLVKPHVNSPYFQNRSFSDMEQEAKDVGFPVYAIDDQSAVVVNEDKISVVSEGEWKKFN